ncbi:MAG: hypothetical protein QOF70_3861, partial [Acetobacteraceae bacterium]|nr:hypothetical protein [Acetobacteraceae bacterium]
TVNVLVAMTQRSPGIEWGRATDSCHRSFGVVATWRFDRRPNPDLPTTWELRARPIGATRVALVHEVGVDLD